MSVYLPKDVKTYRCGAWIIRYSDSRKTLHCVSPDHHVIIITKDTYMITKLPTYVLEFCKKHHLLDFWYEHQKQKALDGLIAIRKRMEDIEAKTRPKIYIDPS